MNYLRWAAILFAFLLPVSVGRAQPSITAESGLFDLLSQTVTQEVSELADSLPELQKDQQSQRVLLDWLFKRPAEKGSMVGQVYCGFFCMAGLTGTGKDDAAAVAWFRKAADQGDALSQLLVAIASAEGRGVGMNDREAVRWFRKLAKNNMDSGLLNMESSKVNSFKSLAHHILAYAYYYGLGVSKSEGKAREHVVQKNQLGDSQEIHGMLTASNQLDVRSILALQPSPRNLSHVLQTWRLAFPSALTNRANEGLVTSSSTNTIADSDLLLRLTQLADRGDPVAANLVFLRSAEEWNHQPAVTDISEYLNPKRLVPIRLIRMAARKGDACAQAFLAMEHASGGFIVQDHLTDFYWASKSAAQGFPLAQLFVAKCYETGDGVERDDVLAYKWYLLAGRELQTWARQGILSCEERLTPGQRMEAQRMVRRHGQRGAAR